MTELGEIQAPSGTLVLADPEALAAWCEDEAAFARRGEADAEAASESDLAIEGPDAEAAGRRFDRSWLPRFIHDVSNRARTELARQFEAMVSEEKLNARLVELSDRVPHAERAAAAVRYGRGAGEISVGGDLVTVARVSPGQSAVKVSAAPMPAGPHEKRWRWVTLVLARGKVTRTEPAGYVTVETGTMLAVDAEALASWHGNEDARRALAALPDRAHGQSVVTVAGTRALVFSTTWGDGAFPVLVDRDARGQPLALRIDLGSERRIALLAEVQKQVLAPEGHLAMVSARVALDGHAACWIYREEPDRPEDSGWRVFAGDEDDAFLEDPENVRMIPLASLTALDATLSPLLGALPGAAFEREAGGAFHEVHDFAEE